MMLHDLPDGITMNCMELAAWHVRRQTDMFYSVRLGNHGL